MGSTFARSDGVFLGCLFLKQLVALLLRRTKLDVLYIGRMQQRRQLAVVHSILV